MTTRPALFDTSILVAGESVRRLDLGSLPDQTAISVDGDFDAAEQAGGQSVAWV